MSDPSIEELDMVVEVIGGPYDGWVYTGPPATTLKMRTPLEKPATRFPGCRTATLEVVELDVHYCTECGVFLAYWPEEGL
jgi:hypothetical protein